MYAYWRGVRTWYSWSKIDDSGKSHDMICWLVNGHCLLFCWFGILEETCCDLWWEFDYVLVVQYWVKDLACLICWNVTAIWWLFPRSWERSVNDSPFFSITFLLKSFSSVSLSLRGICQQFTLFAVSLPWMTVWSRHNHHYFCRPKNFDWLRIVVKQRRNKSRLSRVCAANHHPGKEHWCKSSTQSSLSS